MGFRIPLERMTSAFAPSPNMAILEQLGCSTSLAKTGSVSNATMFTKSSSWRCWGFDGLTIPTSEFNTCTSDCPISPYPQTTIASGETTNGAGLELMPFTPLVVTSTSEISTNGSDKVAASCPNIGVTPMVIRIMAVKIALSS